MGMARARWLGHAAFYLELGGARVLVDPWIGGNPACPLTPDEVLELGKVDVVCVSHDHADHLGDAFKICREHRAKLVCVYEVGLRAQEEGVKADDIHGMNVGGTVEVAGLKITLVPALHSCSAGVPVGFVIKGEGKAVYHAGDTALFGDMALIGRLYGPIDLALLPIGGYYTMGPLEAAEAVALLKPKAVIPMHYATFPVLVQDASEFASLVRQKCPDVKVVVLKPGEVYEF